MSILFKKLSVLFDHYKTLETVLPETDIFFVGWAIRDLLINRTDNPTDIDCSCKAKPDTIRNMIQKDGNADNNNDNDAEKNAENSTENRRSFFRTEKFWTISLYHTLWSDKSDRSNGWGVSNRSDNEKRSDNEERSNSGNRSDRASTHADNSVDNQVFQYEITPFRTEWTYSDLRHPDQLSRSESLREDSKRRDYTINALYRHPYRSSWTTESKHTATDIPTAKKQFAWHPLLVDDVLIIYSAESIQQLDTQWVTQEFVQGALDNAVIIDNGTTQTSWKQLSILVDPHNWLGHLAKWVIQTVGSAEKRFQEDALRVIRWLRFATIFNYTPGITQDSFDFRKSTRKAIKKYAHLVNEVAIERIWQEVDKVFAWHNPYGFVALLQETELLEHVFPYVAQCVENQQPTRHHGFDTYSHTLLTLQAMQTIPQADKAMKLTMLYHDVGKPEQYAFIQKAIQEDPDNPDRSGYEHHADIWINLAKKDLQRLCFPKELIKTVCRYIQYHHRPWEILLWSEKNIDKRLRALISDWGYQQTKNLIYITMADRLWQFNPIQPPQIDHLHTLLDRVDTLYTDEGRFTKRDLVIDGNRVMKEFGLSPWPELWTLLDKTFQRVLTDHTTRNTTKKISDYIKSLLG